MTNERARAMNAVPPHGMPSRPAVCGLHGTRPTSGCAACEIRPVALCAPLAPEELVQMARHVSPFSLEANAVLVQEGDPAVNVYTVTRGMLRRARYLPDGRRQITGFLGPGDLVGVEVANVYHSSLEAVVPSDLCVVTRHNLEDLFGRYPSLKDRLVSFECAELDRAQDLQLSLGRRNPSEKIAVFLLELAARAERAGQPRDPVRLPMTRTDIADYLGLTIETVSRTFTKLRQEGLIRLPAPHLVEIKRRAALEELAGL
jgi:CRP/FNR family transcriptional regulator, anaerobic regulatory protein